MVLLLLLLPLLLLLLVLPPLALFLDILMLQRLLVWQRCCCRWLFCWFRALQVLSVDGPLVQLAASASLDRSRRVRQIAWCGEDCLGVYVPLTTPSGDIQVRPLMGCVCGMHEFALGACGPLNRAHVGL